MKLLQNLKKDKKGFTLVEMIVVIVIIGILLAILVPGMFRYIDKAKDKQIEVNARTAYLNMSTAIAELYGKNGVIASEVQTALKGTFKNNVKMDLTVTGKGTVTIEPFANDEGQVSEVTITVPTDKDKKFEIITFKYEEGTKYIEITGGIWGVVKAAVASGT